MCSVVIIYHQGLFSTCSSSSISTYRSKLSTIFEPFCPAANHETVFSNSLLLISTLKMSIWTCAQRTHGTYQYLYTTQYILYTIYKYTELLFEGNILSYLSNRDVRHLFKGCLYSRALLLSGYKLSVEISSCTLKKTDSCWCWQAKANTLNYILTLCS